MLTVWRSRDGCLGEHKIVTDEHLRSLSATVLAQGHVLEFLLAATLGKVPKDNRASLMAQVVSNLSQIGPKGELSELNAELWADIRVRASERLEAMVARALLIARDD